MKSVLATKKNIEAVDLSIVRWMYDCCIPFNVVNSHYFQMMVDAIASVGRGYKAPTYYAIRGPLLKKNVEDMNNHIDTFRKYWEMTGCTLMADGKLVNKHYGHIFWSPYAAHCIDLMLEKFDSFSTIRFTIDGDDRPSMGYIYEGMRKAKEEIKTSFDGKEKNYMPYIEIVDDKWQTQLGHALHSAGFFLNPSIYYKDMQFATNHRIWSGFLDTVEVMHFKDDEKIMKVTAETDSYRKALDDFGRSQAIFSRDKLLPAIWWQNYGGSTPNLQEMAIRVLSQTCSASGC